MSRHARWHFRWTLLVALWVLAFIPTLSSQQTTGTISGRTVVVSGNEIFVGPFGRPGRKLAEMAMPVPPDNPITADKTALGRRLFFDPLLSNNRSVSCGTCHDPDRGFADGRPLAVGVFDRIGTRNSPALFNRGYGRTQFWDGRTAGLEKLMLEPIADRNEMDLSIDEAIARLNADESYPDAFRQVFNRPVNADDLGRALATFVRTIKSADSPYDRFMSGTADALTAEQQAGLQLFRGKARCSFCHHEPLFTDEAFWNTGIAARPGASGPVNEFRDNGRFAVTGRDQDRGGFKTPTLREIARTAPYMHDGSLATLADVVDFYDKGGRLNRNKFPILRPLNLSVAEQRSLIAFLESLTGVVTAK